MTHLEYFGALVCQAREELGISQQELADEVDLDLRTVRKVELGKSNLLADKALAIATFLHISPTIMVYADPFEDGIELDHIYRLLLRHTPDQIQQVCASALRSKHWEEAHGTYKTLDEYVSIINTIHLGANDDR